MRYRVIPFIGKVKRYQSANDVSNQLEALINEGAKEGWQFEQVNNVNIEVQPGCLAAIFGAKVDYVRFDMVIFKKVIRDNTLAVDLAGLIAPDNDQQENYSLADGEVNNPDTSFCYHCGEELKAPSSICPSCGKEL